MKPLMPLVTIWQDFLLTSSYCPDPVQGHIRHRVLCQHRDVTPPHCWAQEQHTSPSSPGAPFWLHPDALQAGGRSWSLPCLLLVTEQRCCWSVSAVAMGIGRQVLGAGVSNSLETASLHSYCKLQETSKKTTYRAPLPCFVWYHGIHLLLISLLSSRALQDPSVHRVSAPNTVLLFCFTKRVILYD